VSGTVKLNVKDGSDVVATVELSSGTTEAMAYFASPREGAVVSVEVSDDSTGTFTSVSVEILEQWIYQPGHHDAYLCARLGSTDNDALAEIDGDARLKDDNAAWLDQFYDEGWLPMSARSVVQETAAITTNPTFQAFRRFAAERIKWARRQEFVGYEFNGLNSILHFKRFVGGQVSEGADVWRGIAPPYTDVSSGNIEEGVEYEVRGTGGDSVTYDSTVYTPGERFTGVEGVGTFTESGTPSVREYEGIRPDARANGYSNEWVLHINTMPYSPSTSNTYYIENYTDHFPFINRCAVFGKGETGDLPSALQRHFHDASFTTDQGLQNPEAPGGYNYLDTVNTPNPPPGNWTGDEAEFAKSCPIYPRPYYVLRCQSYESGGTEYVKVTIQGRLHSCDQAPGIIDDDTDTNWLDNITYRTDENALVEYLEYPTRDCGQVTGDTSVSDDDDHQAVQGSCVPRFHLTKLVEKPYHDNNSQSDDSDTTLDARHLATLEWYLRAMCEGWVDSATTESIGDCESEVPSLASEVYDYTFENLLYQTSGVRSISPIIKNIINPPPDGHGQLPGQIARAEGWNTIARAVNALTRARVAIPASLERRTKDYEAIEEGSGWEEVAGSCGDLGRVLRYKESQPLLATELVDEEDWEPIASSWTAVSRQEITPNCQNGEFAIERFQGDVDFRWEPSDLDLRNAIHPDILELMQTSPVVMARLDEYRHIPEIVEDNGDFPDFTNNGQGYSDTAPATRTTTCKVVSQERVRTSISQSDLAYWRDGVGQEAKTLRAIHSITLTVGSTALTPVVEVPTVACAEELLGTIENLTHTNPPWLGESIELDWDDTTNATAYDVEVSIGGSVVNTYEVTTSSFSYDRARILADSADVRTVEFRVRPKNATYTGAWAAITVSNAAPYATTWQYAAINDTDVDVDIIVAQPGGGTHDRRIHIAQSSGFTPSEATANEPWRLDAGPAASLSPLAQNTTYYAVAELRDDWDLAHGTTSFTGEITFTTTGSTTVADLTGLADDGWLGDEVVFSWDAATNATSYSVVVLDDSGTTRLNTTTASTSYTWTTSAINTAGGPWRPIHVTVTPTAGSDQGASQTLSINNTKPDPVTAVTATDLGSGSVRVDWTNPVVSDKDAIRVYYKETAGVTTGDSYVSTTGETATITGVTAGATLYFRVEFRDTYVGDDYPITDEQSIDTSFSLATPTGLNAGDWNGEGLSLSWTAVANATGYKIDVRPNGGAVARTYTTASPALSYSLADLLGDNAQVRSVEFRVRATAGAEESSEATYTASNTKPGAVTGVTSSSPTDGVVIISWTADTDLDLRGYRVYYAESTGVTTSSPFVFVVGTSVTLSSLTAGGTLYYRIESVDEFVTDYPITAEASQAITAVTPVGAVTSLAWGGVWTGKTGTLTWTAASGALRYRVLVKVSGVTVGTYYTTETEWTYTTAQIVADGAQLRSGVSFDVRGEAGDQVGTADTVSVSNSQSGPATAGVTVTVTTNSMTIDWADATDADGDHQGYNVYFGLDELFDATPETKVNPALLTTSAILVSGLDEDTRYCFKVEFVDSFANAHLVTNAVCDRTLTVPQNGSSSSHSASSISSSSTSTAPTYDLAIANLDDDNAEYSQGDWDGYNAELTWDAATDATRYEVEIWPTGATSPAKTYDVYTNAFSWSGAMIEEAGGPWRSMEWRVTAEREGQRGNTLTLAVNNPQVDMPASLSASRNQHSITWSWSPDPSDTNWAGVRIYISLTPGIDTTTATPFISGAYSGGVSGFLIDGNLPHYWVIEFYDEFDGLHATSQEYVSFP